MSGLNASLYAVIIVIFAVSVLTVIFPENKYKKHLMFMTKIVVVLAFITVFMKSKDSFKFSTDHESYGYTNNYGAVSAVHDEIKTDIKEYVEASFDTKCEVNITEDEVIIYVSSGDKERIKTAVKQKFGIDSRVVKNEE